MVMISRYCYRSLCKIFIKIHQDKPSIFQSNLVEININGFECRLSIQSEESVDIEDINFQFIQ